MFPEEPRDTGSNAERKIFGLIKQELGDDWIGLHSLGLASHRSKPWTEIDFVLIGPPGVFCLEVKGGRIARKNGLYLYTNKDGKTTTKKEGPFEQVAPATAALRNHLVKLLPTLKSHAVGFGVLTPDITFNITGPDIIPEVLYDDRDGARRFATYIRRVADYWHKRLEKQNGHPIPSLAPALVHFVHDELRGDFDLRPSLRTRIGQVNEELLSLTTEQYNILDALSDNDRAVIKGGPGTGKTLLAIEEALRQARSGAKVLLCCYNRNLASFIKDAVRGANNLYPCNLHSFMATTVKEAGLAAKLPAAEEDDLYTIFYPELCLEVLLNGDQLSHFDVLIMDEGQDLLRQNYLDVFDALLKGGIASGRWRIFLDQNQDIFKSHSTQGLETIRKSNPAQFRLTINCRNTKPIAVATQIISTIRCNETLKASGPDVEHEWHKDPSEQRRNVSKSINRMLSGGVQPNDIVVLSRYRYQNSSLCDGLFNVYYPLLEEETDKSVANGKYIRFATISSFKGLESDAILLVDIDDLTGAHHLDGGHERPSD